MDIHFTENIGKEIHAIDLAGALSGAIKKNSNKAEPYNKYQFDLHHKARNS